MSDRDRSDPEPDELDSRNEIIRLKKIVNALMDRAERSASIRGSDFSQFQSTIMLEDQVRKRTAELEAVLRENEKINRAVHEANAKFRGLVSQSLVGICMVEDGKFAYANGKFNEMFGYSADEIRELGPLDLTVESDRPFMAESLRRQLSGEVNRVESVARGLRKNGEVIDVEIHENAMEIDGKRTLISLLIDVTERMRVEREVRVLQERLREQATHDALTGLYNRRYLDESLVRELVAAERQGHPVSVIMGDLDHFKAVNDRYGHLAGDEVLRAFGQLMKQHARSSDICCRYGGEEFVLVLPNMTEDDAFQRSEELRDSMARFPVVCDGQLISVTASFGIATFPRHGATGDEVVAAADYALYAAKAAGRNRVMVSGPRGAPSALPLEIRPCETRPSALHTPSLHTP